MVAKLEAKSIVAQFGLRIRLSMVIPYQYATINNMTTTYITADVGCAIAMLGMPPSILLAAYVSVNPNIFPPDM